MFLQWLEGRMAEQFQQWIGCWHSIIPSMAGSINSLLTFVNGLFVEYAVVRSENVQSGMALFVRRQCAAFGTVDSRFVSPVQSQINLKSSIKFSCPPYNNLQKSRDCLVLYILWTIKAAALRAVLTESRRTAMQTKPFFGDKIPGIGRLNLQTCHGQRNCSDATLR